ncbi:MAG: type II toxin-antitoxin system mRNA interferase toxin, RelE/StbE family [bacterium]|nr:type II toxin-antitoxin system mRNA interferase toxin, RelE/StbE family [bacterium]
MEIKGIKTSGKFRRQYKRLPEKIKKAAQEKENIFRNNVFDFRLNTHKLHGKDKEAWAFYVTPRSYRIKFIFLTAISVLFLEIGKHDIYT